MNIIYIVCSGRGGSNVSLLYTLKELKLLGVTPLVVVPDRYTADLFESNGFRTQIIRFFPSIWPQVKKITDVLKFIPRLFSHNAYNIIAVNKIVDIASSFKPSIIHTNVAVYTIGYYVSRITHIPHVWHIREYITKDFGYVPFPSFRIHCNRLNRSYTIAISKDLINHFHLIKNSRVVYNGILSESEKYFSAHKDNYLLYVGALTEGKGVANLISAYLDFKKRFKTELKLLIVGSGTPEYENYLKKVSLDDASIIYLGHRKDVYELMSKASCLIVPSISEAFGRITAEAMFNHCPVIGYNTAGTKEQFDNGITHTGKEIAFRYNSHEELVSALQLINEKRYSNDMLEAAYSTVLTLYTPQANANYIMQYYKEIKISQL